MSPSGVFDLVDGGAGVHEHVVVLELCADQAGEFGVECGEHFGAALQLQHVHAAGGERLGHLETDVAGADDDRASGVLLVQLFLQGEGVAHGVDRVQPVTRAEGVEPGDAGVGGEGAGADDQLVVADQFLTAGLVADGELAPFDVDAGGEGVQPQPHSGGFQVGVGAVRERLPRRDLPVK